MASLHVLANPARFRRFSQRVLPALSALTALALAAGLCLALVQSPPDYQQGETVRIMFVHVPSAWLAMAGYALLAVLGASLLVWRHPLAALMARAAAPVGAVFAAVCLLTGSLWGRPMWGTYWVWDARLTSMLLLFFLYLGHIALEPRLRRCRARRPRRRDPGAGRRDQPAGDQVLGRLVEHAAPAGLGDEARRPVDPSRDPDAAAGHGGWRCCCCSSCWCCCAPRPRSTAGGSRSRTELAA